MFHCVFYMFQFTVFLSGVSITHAGTGLFIGDRF